METVMKKVKQIYKGKNSTLFFSFLAMFLVASIVVICISIAQKRDNIKNAEYLVESEVKKIQYAIDSRLLNIEILEMLVISHGGSFPDFDDIAAQLFSDDPALRSLQLAPDGIVTYVYPTTGNENVHFNLFEDPEQSAEAILARDTGEMTLAGPQELKQGGMGVIARKPIYLRNQDGSKTFWGFSTVVLNIPEIFDMADLDLLGSQNYHYRIWRNNPADGEIQIISENSDQVFTNPVRGSITVPNGIWYLEIVPQAGWIPVRSFLLQCMLAMAIILLSTIVLAGILTILQQRRELVLQTNIDPLTGIKNSRYFLNMLKDLADGNVPFTVFYLDMNDFKQINDHYGHDTGDYVLKETAVRICQCISKADTATRIGGDEFTITTTHAITEEDCLKLKSCLKQTVGTSMMLNKETSYSPSISVGFARFPVEAEDVESVIRLADQRMYEEKRRMKVTLIDNNTD